uniref:Uncharacterized protein n=1 Tax=Calidris pygmaea TaxID=425635 RepID=A0A8C3JIB5_9CHAR
MSGNTLVPSPRHQQAEDPSAQVEEERGSGMSSVLLLPDVPETVLPTLHFHANHCMFMQISSLLEGAWAGETRSPGNGLLCLCLELCCLWHGTVIITFSDFLPLLLGSGFQRLILLYQGCNESVGPQVFNIFTLAFPIAHTSVPPTVDCLNQNYKPIDPKILLRNTSFAVWRIVKEGGIDLFLWILMANQAKLMTQQPMVVDELWDQMFEKVERTGFDLPTLNLQLSRDRGLSGYNSWRQFCGISQPSVLETLAQVLRNHGLAENVMQLYGTTKNIDIWIGALAESFVNGGRVGPLMTCLIGIQFRNALDGDRFWWFFTSQQRSSLAQTFLSQIMCDSTHISEVPRLTFKANKYPFGFVSSWNSERTEEGTERCISFKQQRVPACKCEIIRAPKQSS